MNSVETLAAFVAGLTLDQVPGPVVERARRVLIDTAGATIAGSTEPELQALQAELAGGGPASILGAACRADAASAALLNAMAACWLELDEGNRFAAGHPAIHVVPIVLALGEARDVSGTAVLEALIAGYEVAARAGRAVRLRPELHPHGTWGALGAAAAVARLAGDDAPTVARAIEIAASLSIAPPTAAAIEGATVRNANAGLACQHGIVAAALARAGVSAPRDALGLGLGTILGTTWDASRLTAGLGDRFEIEASYFKPYAACRHTHGAIDLLLQLRARQPFEASEVESIVVESYAATVALDAPITHRPLAARFSVPTLLALVLLGDADLHRIDDETLRDPALHALAGRVQLRLDPEMDRQYPAARQTRLTVTLDGGRILHAESDTVIGDPECPLPVADLDAKFLDLAGRVLGNERASQALATLMAIDRINARTAVASLTR
ncbi:MAG: MmgE/PrpD family protein [Dehalococcoidia bacterium]